MLISFWPVPFIVLLFVVAGLAAMGAIGALSVRFSLFRTDPDARSSAYDLSKLVGSVIGLVLIFMLTQGMNYYREAEAAVSKEAGDILQLDHALAGVSPTAGAPARLRLLDYVRSVIEQEWPAMQRSTDSEATERAMEALQASVRTVLTTDPSGATLLRVQKNLDDIEDDRTRRLGAADSGLPVPLWGTIGLLFVLLGASLLFMEPTTAQFRGFALYVTCLTVMAALLFAVDDPYRGDFSISPRLLQRSLARIAAS